MNKVSINILAAAIIALPALALAQSFGLENPINVNSISDLILIVTRVVRYIAIPFVVIMIMYAGFLFILPTGWNSPADTVKAKNTLFYVVIGAFILLSSELIALVIRNTINGLTR